MNPWLALPAALAAGVATGLLVERLIVQPLYKRPLDAILATWGLGIVIGQLHHHGLRPRGAVRRFAGAGRGELAGHGVLAYRLFLIPAALLLYLLLTLLLNRTRFGRTRAVIMNENLARGLGIQAERIRLATFGLGGLGALAGVLITPLSSVDPNMACPGWSAPSCW